MPAVARDAAPAPRPTCGGFGWLGSVRVPLAEGLAVEAALADLTARVVALEKKGKP